MPLELAPRRPARLFAHWRQRAGRTAAARVGGRGVVRRVLARALQHRCLDLPDRADRRGGAARPSRRRDRACRSRRTRASRCCRAAAEPRSAARRVGEALVIDCSRHLNACHHSTPRGADRTVQPGLVLDQLNKQSRSRTGCSFRSMCPPAAQLPIGGMTGNNQLRLPLAPLRQHGAQRPRHRCRLLADGSVPFRRGRSRSQAQRLRASRTWCCDGSVPSYRREADEIDMRWPEGAAPGQRL